MNIKAWIQKHKNLTVIVILLLGLYYWKNSVNLPLNLGGGSYGMSISESAFSGAPSIGRSQKIVSDSFPPLPAAITPSTSTHRLKTYTASLSMVVTDVAQSLKAIEQTATSTGGFLIDSHLSSPEEGAYGTVSLRVPSDQLQSILELIKGLGVRVTQESITSADLTDEYEDIDAKLASLQSTMTKFETILNQADTVEESMRVQEQLLNLQDRSDGLVGRKQYLEKSSELSLVTVTIASDELSLPYAPQDTWRPQLVFKQAVRSLVQSARTLVNYLIWLGVYAIIWIPLLIGLFLFARRQGRKTAKTRA